MVIDNPRKAVTPLASASRRTNEVPPVTLGVPEMTPVAPSSERPVGRVLELSDRTSGALPPLTITVCEYGAPE
jgi:hypothetical protein